MTLLRLKTCPIILIEDNENANPIPLIQELASHENTLLHFVCYEQPIILWKNVFKRQSNVIYHEGFETRRFEKYTSEKCTIVIDSVNQMTLDMGWHVCLKMLKSLIANPNVNKMILNLHLDCLHTSSKIRLNLNHIASAVISFDTLNTTTLHILLKKSGKLVKSDEKLTYDKSTEALIMRSIVKDVKKEEEQEKPLPQNLTTFKIEVDQTEKLEKYKLQLPYMSKINEGNSKIFYEPDAVDDWDEEDPDDDLDI